MSNFLPCNFQTRDLEGDYVEYMATTLMELVLRSSKGKKIIIYNIDLTLLYVITAHFFTVSH